MQKIGVLALQGSFNEHINALSKIEGVLPCEVKTLQDLKMVSGLIIPGGESTTIGKLLRDFDLLEPIKKRINEGLPTWGTCAGLILLAKNIVEEDIVHLGVLDVSVRRNAYGTQLDSFIVNKVVPQISSLEQSLVFIRAPWIEEVGQKVNTLLIHNDKIVAVKQSNILGTSFHPELSEDLIFHKYFVNMCQN